MQVVKGKRVITQIHRQLRGGKADLVMNQRKYGEPGGAD